MLVAVRVHPNITGGDLIMLAAVRGHPNITGGDLIINKGVSLFLLFHLFLELFSPLFILFAGSCSDVWLSMVELYF